MLNTAMRIANRWLLLLLVSLTQTSLANSVNGVAETADSQLFYAASRIKDGNLDRIAAFTLTFAMLADGRLDETDKNILLQLSAANSTGLTLTEATGSQVKIPAPDADARPVFGILAASKNMNEYWLQGDEPMKDLVILAYLAAPAWQRTTQFVASKLYEQWRLSNLENGYGPIRNTLTAAYAAGPKIKEDDLLGYAKATLLFDAMQMIDQHEQDKIPDFIYSWLPHDSSHRPYDRAPMPTKALSVQERRVELHKAIRKAATSPTESGNWGFLPPMYGINFYTGEQCAGEFFASFAMFGVAPTSYRLIIDYKSVKNVAVNQNAAGEDLLTIQGQCAFIPLDEKDMSVKPTAFSPCQDVKIDKKTKKANAQMIANAMAQIASSCAM